MFLHENQKTSDILYLILWVQNSNKSKYRSASSFQSPQEHCSPTFSPEEYILYLIRIFISATCVFLFSVCTSSQRKMHEVCIAPGILPSRFTPSVLSFHCVQGTFSLSYSSVNFCSSLPIICYHMSQIYEFCFCGVSSAHLRLLTVAPLMTNTDMSLLVANFHIYFWISHEWLWSISLLYKLIVLKSKQSIHLVLQECRV